MKNQIISIVTPSYNQADFIAKTIESVLSQSGDFYLDYIIYDAVSKDNSLEIIKNYEELLSKNGELMEKDGLKFYVSKNPDFKLNKCLGISYRWFSEKDKGQSEAINKGFQKAQGEIVAWLNSDDYYLENIIGEVIGNFAAKSSEHGILYGKAIAIDQDGKELWNYDLPDLNLYILINKKTMIPQPSIFFKRQLFEKYGFVRNDLHYCMDYELLVRFLYNDVKVIKFDKNLSVQTYHDASKSCSQSERFIVERAEINKSYKKKFSFLTNLSIWKFRFKYKYIPYLTGSRKEEKA